MSLQEEERLHTARYVTCFLLVCVSELLHWILTLSWKPYAKIPVNVVDVKDRCSFIFPSMIKKGPVTVAISSGGASPVLTRLLKDRMKQVLPEQTEGIAEQLGNLRKEIFSLFPDLSTKRAAVFTELAELALDQEKTLKEDQIRQIILKYRNQE